MFEFEIDNRKVLAALQELHQRTGNVGPALRAIGEDMVESTKQRFATKTGPNGAQWANNSDVTISAPKKLPMGGYEIKGRNDPLIDHHTLSDSIDHQLFGNNELLIGSPMEHAAMMQFGGTRSEFPNLWGDIPARPFLGISDDDESMILNTIRRHLENI